MAATEPLVAILAPIYPPAPAKKAERNVTGPSGLLRRNEGTATGHACSELVATDATDSENHSFELGQRAADSPTMYG